MRPKVPSLLHYRQKTSALSGPGLRFAAVAMGLLLLLWGCASPPDTPLRVGTNIWIGYEPLYLARARGELPPDQVRLVEYLSTTQAMRGLLDGVVDAAAVTLDEALLLSQTGANIDIVLVMDYSAGADALLVNPAIHSLNELRGKRIGVETTALGAYLMQRVLDKAGLSIDEVTVVSLDQSLHEEAYLNKRVDAVITFEPTLSHLLNMGAKVLLDSSKLPGEVVDVLVIRRDMVKMHEEHLKKLLKSWYKTIAFVERNPALAAHTMDTRMKLGEAGILNALQEIKFPDYLENLRLLGGTQPALQQQARRLATVMERHNLLQKGVDVSRLFNKTLLLELYPR